MPYFTAHNVMPIVILTFFADGYPAGCHGPSQDQQDHAGEVGEGEGRGDGGGEGAQAVGGGETEAGEGAEAVGEGPEAEVEGERVVGGQLGMVVEG